MTLSFSGHLLVNCLLFFCRGLVTFMRNNNQEGGGLGRGFEFDAHFPSQFINGAHFSLSCGLKVGGLKGQLAG